MRLLSGHWTSPKIVIRAEVRAGRAIFCIGHHESESRNQVWRRTNKVPPAEVAQANPGDHGSAGFERGGDRASQSSDGYGAGKSEEAGGMDTEAATVIWRVFAANATSPVCERRNTPLPWPAIPPEGHRGDGGRCKIKGAVYLGAYATQAGHGAGAEAGRRLVSGARERPTGTKFCGKRGTDGGAAGESAQDASAPDEQALGKLDATRRGVAKPGVGASPGVVY